jgi:transposase-like protein
LEDERVVVIKIKCVHCQSKEIVKMGYQKNGAPRCKCKNCGKTFQREYINKGAKPETKEMIIKMAVNGSGIRDTARVLGISKDTVMSVLKKLKNLSQILIRSTKI